MNPGQNGVRSYSSLMGGGNSEQRARWPVMAIAAAVLLAGCGGSDDSDERGPGEPNIVQAGAPGEPSRTLSKDEAEELEETPHTKADVDFMRGMIHHHAQALLMTSLVRKRSGSDRIPLLARRTEISQQAEIETMERWLRARSEKPPDAESHRSGHGPGASLMPGMVSAHKLARLAAAEGGEFDELFLKYMIRHHQGALTMVRELAAEGGGNEPEIGAFTRHVEADQGIEIARMQDLRDEKPDLASGRDGPSRAERERAQRLSYAGGRPLICYVG
jgi:uncharacterized protein (DUF305 family)